MRKKVEPLLSKSILYLHERVQDLLADSNYEQSFAPCYVADVCGSGCSYCFFRKSNQFPRRILSPAEINEEIDVIAESGLVDAVYVLSGSFKEGEFDKANTMLGVNANGLKAVTNAGLFPVLESSPFSSYGFAELAKCLDPNVGGRFTLFMETYDEDLYRSIHSGDRYKSDPNLRLAQTELAIQAGWSEVGIGALIGLNENPYLEISGLLAHQDLLLRKYGDDLQRITISVPRIKGVMGQFEIAKEAFKRFTLTTMVLALERSTATSGVVTMREEPEMYSYLSTFMKCRGVGGMIVGAEPTKVGGYTQNVITGSVGQFPICNKDND